MSELIDRQAAIDALERIFDRCEEIEAHLPEDDPDRTGYKMYPDYTTVWKYLHQLPSVQQDRKPSEWLHDLLQDAIDAGTITETQASRLMDRIAEDNT